MSKYNELVKKLKEIFQIDRPELDFGIYRILNTKGDEINDYLENTLKKKISDALATAGNANKEELEKQLITAIKAAEDAGFDPEDSPKVKDLRLQIVATSQGANEHENAVFTHLLTFFSRYYDSGDFVSKRRYKGDAYAIPYAGEEVLLHWANKDQYYIKSGENFANYSFKLEDGRKVSFKLLTADTAKDNRKDNDADRRFILIEPHIRTKFDDEGSEYEEEYQPVTVIKSGDTEELIIQFEYKAVKKGTKQETLVLDALKSVLTNEQVQNNWVDITNREPTDKNPNRTLLEKHFTTYTQRNTADYFIHKDLGGFLSNELDFYIKNEVMNLDNVQNAEIFADIEKQLRMIQCLRSISLDIITFLAQLENFQKKLWTKKKFITKSDYCISLNKLSKSLQDKVLECSELWNDWINLGLVINKNEKDSDQLRTLNLPVDTKYLDILIKNQLLEEIEDIDSQVDGVIVGSDNYHSLKLLSKKYEKKIDLVHIDPPYNTFSSGFLYKNSFQHSSWLSLMESRITASLPMLANNFVYQSHIDENEYERLFNLFDDKNLGYLSSIIWNKQNPMMGGKGLAFQHEYIIWGSDSDEPFPMKNENVLEMIEYKDSLISKYNGVTEEVKLKYSKWVKSNKKLSGGELANQYIEDDGRIYQSVGMSWPNPKPAPEQFFRPLIHPVTGEECPVPPRGWSRSPDKMDELVSNNEIIFGKDHNTQPRRKIYLTTESKKPIPSVISSGAKGKVELDHMGLNFSYCHPTSLYETLFYAGLRGKRDGIILDYFGGSGTTAHATLKLNKFDNGNRKYILFEQGQHLESVLLPRIKKAMFSENWKKGVATIDDSGSSHCFKYMYLESYEDTLNNLELKKIQTTGDLFESMSEQVKSDYLLNYMLDTESKGSLLSTDDFKKPFDYKMKIAVDSAGASEEQNIDLVETFNYLIGLHVNTIESNLDKGYVRIEGKLPSGERALVLWRDCEKIQYDDFTKFASRFDLFAKQKTFDVIYVNGDHNLPTAFTNDEGEVTRTLKLRQIEPEFLEQMFAPDELA